MFGKRRKKDHSTLNFKTPNYTMNDEYNTKNLVVAKLQYVSSKPTDFGPMVETTKQRYIFEKVEEEDNVRYREVFTGFVAKDSEEYFDLPYVKPSNSNDSFVSSKSFPKSINILVFLLIISVIQPPILFVPFIILISKMYHLLLLYHQLLHNSFSLTIKFKIICKLSLPNTL